MAGKPAFDPSGDFVSLDKPAFDDKKAFVPVEDGGDSAPPPAAAKPAFDPKANYEPVDDAASAPPPSAAPMPSGQEDDGTNVEPIAKPPLPRPRPASAPSLIQPTQPMPPVAPLEDVPFRAPLKGVVWDPEQQKDVTAPGLTGMLTGEQLYAEREFKIAGAKDTVAEAEARLAAAKERQAAAAGATVAKVGGSRQQQLLEINDEVDRAKENLDQARIGLSTTEREAPPTQTPLRSAATGFAQTVATGFPTMAAGVVRPIDMALDAAGIKKGTGIADALDKATASIAAANPTDPGRQSEFTQKMTEGAASTIPFFTTGIVGKALGAPQALISGLAGGSQQAEQYYVEADALGQTAMQKALAYAAGFGIGGTEAFGLGRTWDKLDEVTGGGVKRYFGALLKDGGEEAVQEGVQQLLENIAKYKLMDKDPGDITADVGTNALMGAVLGASMAGTLHAPTLFGGYREGDHGVPVPPQTPVTPEDIAKQVASGDIPIHTPTDPPPPGGPMVVDVAGKPVAVPTDPDAVAGTVPVTPVATGEPDVTTTVKVTPGTGLDAMAQATEGETAIVDPRIGEQPVRRDVLSLTFMGGGKGTSESDGRTLDVPLREGGLSLRRK